MARIATSQLPREAAEIKSDDRFLVDQPTVVDPITGLPGDTRKVSPAVLAEGMAQQTAIIGLVDSKVAAETARAEAAEGNLSALTTSQKTSLVLAVNELNGECDANAAAIAAEETRAKGVEGTLSSLNTTDKTNLAAAVNSVKQESDANAQQVTLLQTRAGALEAGKADKITFRVIRSLAELQAGDRPGLITFDTSAVPAPPAQEESVVFDDGGVLLLDEYGAFSYQAAEGGVTALIDGGAWQVSSADTGTAAVFSVTALDGAAWSAGTWDAGAGFINLAEVKEIADGARSAADAALPRAGVVNGLETGGTGKALSAEQGKTLAAQIAGLVSGQAGRGVVRNAYTPQGESYRVTAAELTAGGAGYAAGDALFLHGSGSFIPATVIVTAADGAGAITEAELSMPGSFPADVPGDDIEPAGGNGAGAAFTVTAVSEPNTVLADIPNPAPNDFAFVLEDETRGGETWRYANLDYNGDGIYNWVPVIKISALPRDFTADPLAAGELATGAVTLAKHADVSLTGLAADSTDFDADVSGAFAAVFTSIIRKIRGLFAFVNRAAGFATAAQGAAADNAVLLSGGQEIAGQKTFTSVPFIPTAEELPATPSAVKPVTEKQLDLAREWDNIKNKPSFAAPPVLIAAAKKYNGATAALKFKFTRSPGFSTVTDGDVFYRVKARIKNIHSGAFFDLDVSWIPQVGTYDFCTLIRLSATDPMLPAYFYMSNDSNGYFGWIPLATNAVQHWEASAEMWAADTGNNVISGVYEPQITFEASNPSGGRTKAATVI